MIKKVLKVILIAILGIIIVRAVLSVMNLNSDKGGMGDKIAVLELTGTIIESEKTLKQLKELKENKNIKGLIFRVNSPGGGVTVSNEIYNELLNFGKPLYASMGSVAASGGYMVSLAAEKIYAEATTITGSIGVIMNMANTEELFNKIGIKSIVLKSGKFKDIGNPDRPMTEEERQILMAVVMDMYNQFVDMVALRRNMPREDVLLVADGRIITGRMALEVNLVDKIGNVQTAFEDMKEATGLKDAELYLVPKEQKWWEKMASSALPERVFGENLLRPGIYYLADVY